ncbi:MAG: riboflavin biosynthesis protein RibF [Bacteroidia bacterium]|nr:riboflavin biosynthesis protein RibF [Bacteroidia bacterium]MDW8133494.1 riboflavin biosynthesis protein RibF [Bacteroidia bacterium]
MQLLKDREKGRVGGILTLGTFDGVHRGHKALLEASKAWAKEIDTFVEVWLYEPHPRTIVRGETLPLLTTLEEKIALLEESNVEITRVVSFTSHLASLSAVDFLNEWILSLACPKGVVLGYDHRFGKGREGSADMLRNHGIPVREVAPVMENSVPISSSHIRQLLGAGAVSEAQNLLGYPYSVGGTVRLGRREARHLGTPTANILWPIQKVRLPAGVYVGWAVLNPAHSLPAREGIPALIYLPPEGDLEVHLLSAEGDFYGSYIRVGFLEKLRSYREFQDRKSLIEQIELDLNKSRDFFGMKKDVL